MTLGTLALIVSLILFILLSLGLALLPQMTDIAFAFMVLGLLLAGWPLPPWPRR